MKTLKYILILTMMLFVALQSASAGNITLAGSTSVMNYIEAAAKLYSKTHPDITFSISGGGSQVGYLMAKNGRVHIGMMSRNLSTKELSDIEKIKVVPFAYDAVIPVISDAVFLTTGLFKIDIRDLINIYQGKITNWQEVGGPDRLILAIHLGHGHGGRYIFDRHILKGVEVKKDFKPVTVGSYKHVQTLIKASDQAIAYIGSNYPNEQAHRVPLMINGKLIHPTRESIVNGTYPLSRNLNLLLADDAPAHVRDFVNFVLSNKGQKLVDRLGYVPL
ncbi:phosphate transport system substrate-binding protein [Mariprofundus micogutta]|uniref:Phosphate transport system substrate-binding protein n=1 Tax=Mariprofundus micogutta TaxID=1921010 RepID=A0A1L8CMK0_9PROT|nr:substrate-binding domain-containing protein [Mariprofundus micogutta]GAV20133.1 phosphate transport system substrate-binding protein [Mariprofundus micogutta]